MCKKASLVVASLVFVFFQHAGAQTTTIVDTSSGNKVIVIPGKQYQRGPIHRFLWGSEHRNVWTVPVTVQRLNLDTMFGGLTATEKGGGTQTRNLRFKSASGREYAIRSVDKRYGKSLPEELKGTFIEDLVDDQMSSAHPYSATLAKHLAQAAGIYHTDPLLFFVPKQVRLDSFNTEFGDQLYTLEDRPGSDNAKYYGATDVIDTKELLDELLEKPAEKPDQLAFAKRRLFDMMIGDWDRHHDQWKWAKKNINDKVYYEPLPKDRDQAFSSYDGVIIRIAAKAAKVNMMLPLQENIKDMAGYTWLYREVDIPMTAEVTLDQWLSAAKDLQQQITDTVIEQAVRQLPAEAYAVSGVELAKTIISRRNNLQDFASDFYKVLAKEIDIRASNNNDLIEFSATNNNQLQLKIYATNNNNQPSGEPYFSRLLSDDETTEVRVYGMDGADQFVAADKYTGNIRVRLIGGEGQDSYDLPSGFARTFIYDDHSNNIKAPGARLRLDNDTSVHVYNIKSHKRDEFGIMPKLSYSNEDRLFVGLGLKSVNHSFRKKPYASSNELAVHYSISQKAFSYSYKGIFIEALGKWHIGLAAEYDEVRDQDFLGIGNNTIKANDQRQYYRYRNSEANAGINFIRNIGSYQTITATAFYQNVKLLGDANRFISDLYIPAHPGSIDIQHFVGGRATYDYTNVNDQLVPRSGIRFTTSAEYTANTNNENTVKRISGLFGFIVPVGPLTLAVKTGGSTLWGQPEFYQLNKIGGFNTLRGFLRYRFYGNTMLYNQNELQWNFNVKSYIFNGKMGLLALFDNGRVWHPGENSNKWHTAVGGGLMIAPFKKISVTGVYAVSAEDKRFSVRIGHLLKH
jgi:hypothetical protein